MMFRTHTPKRWKERLKKTGSSDDGWTIHHQDPETDEQWVEYFPYHEDRAPSYFRKEEIPGDPEELIRCCLTSSVKDDWQGVGAHASGAFDTELVADILEKLHDEVPRKALKEFGRFFQRYDNRDIVGMNYQQVTESYERFLSACDRIAKATKTQKAVLDNRPPPWNRSLRAARNLNQNRRSAPSSGWQA